MTNKTPLQELIEHLEEIQKRSIGDSFYNGINCGITKAQSLLEKEKNIIVDAYNTGHSDEANGTLIEINREGEEYFNQTFKP